MFTVGTFRQFSNTESLKLKLTETGSLNILLISVDSLEETSDLEVLVQWNQPTFLSLLASLFGSPVDVTSENFLSLFEGALYFGMEMILSKCKMWLTKAMSVNRAPLVQVNDLIGIWEFGSEIVNNYLPELCTSYLAKNFIWAMSCSSFGDVPQDLLLSSIQHPHLTVDSEEHLCGALLAWIAANKERCTEDVSIDLLKQIRISLLPLWFVAGKSTYQSLSMCSNASSCRSITILKQPSTYYMDALRDGDLHNLRIRLTEFTQRMDLSGCPQIKPAIILLSVLPCPLSLEPLLRKKIKQLVINHELLNGNAFKISWEMWPNLIFEAVQEIDISNCPMLPLEVAVECFSMSFPSLRTLKAANHLSFSTTKVLQLVKRCPLLCDIDLTVDVSPVIPTRMSILSSFPATQTSSASFDLTGSPLPGSRSYMSRPLLSNITKLTLEGRIDVCDFDLQTISNICVSLTYLSLKGCTSLSDVGMSALICKCLKLNSIVACDTFFGQQSILALFSLNNCYDRVAAKHSEKNILPACNLQMLHMGGCKGINMTTFSELMFQAYMLKSLCLRETQVLDDGLFSFFGSSLEVLDVSNTKVSAAAVAHVIGRNPGLRCLKARGCESLLQQEIKIKGREYSNKIFPFELGKFCKLDEISVGWGFSYISLEALKPAVSCLKAIEVGLGGMLGQDGLKRLPAVCPSLESVVLYFQVISDHLIVNLLESLTHLKSFALCHCLGETSSLSFKVSMPNLRKLRLERVAPWMSNADLVSLSRNCANLIELSLLGCRLLNSESQKIISSCWPGLISIHLEECGDVTSDGVVSLFDCHAIEDILLRHNGSGIQKDFIGNAVKKLPMLRKISLDICDAKDKDFDIPELDDRHFLSHVKIARCKSQGCNFNLQHVRASRSPVHTETLVLVWDSKQLTRTIIKERV
ncbi:BTB/POZ domain-containing protein FBL11 isoform X2 [Cynara cardunculus var. scolymus]|uniref:BTB/POZ domain-containing protein FBL11 isoform X2 n=1 Tax=Cynara cardunculus var. scolymus TaxID=59895 RepID=UPI000D62A3C3|nr:BTB/POZ domain-containing protein FBL11 isoform X2 [Cynara cardunculus var. scolymus]